MSQLSLPLSQTFSGSSLLNIDRTSYDAQIDHTRLSDIFGAMQQYLLSRRKTITDVQTDFKPVILWVNKNIRFTQDIYYLFENQICFSKMNVMVVFKVTQLNLKKYLLVGGETPHNHSSCTFGYRNITNHQLAASKGVAPKAYALGRAGSNCGFLIKISQQVELNEFLKDVLLPFEKKLAIAQSITHNLNILHSELNIGHHHICPSTILVEEKSGGKISVEFNNFSYSYRGELRKLPLQQSKYTPPEATFDIYAQPQERMALDYSSKHLDLYNLGQTLYFVFKANHFQDDFNDYIAHPLRAKEIENNLLQVESLDDYSIVFDDIVRDFLQFKFSIEEQNIISAIRGLLRTIPKERICLKSVIELLKVL